MSRHTGNDAPYEVARARAYLERRTWPRLQMSVIVLTTAAAGFLVSFLLLRSFDMQAMTLRYPLAILAAYVVFLLLMWIWIRWREHLLDGLDVPGPSRGNGPDWGGAGGHSGGGGASGSWTDGIDASPLDVVDGDTALPLLGAVVLVIVASVAVVATGWVIWSAPALMAELIVDAAIAGSLYRRMRREEAQGWWWLCMRHTFWPLLGVLAFFVALGGVLQHFAPEATTLMEALRIL